MPGPIHGARVRARAHRLDAPCPPAAAWLLAALVSLASPWSTCAAPDRFAMGKPLFDKACGHCHQVGRGAGNGIGPELNGIIGAPAGIVPGYEYSSADRRSAVIWTRQAFDAYIENPGADMPGTRMNVPGVASKAERDAIFAYVARFEANGVIRREKR